MTSVLSSAVPASASGYLRFRMGWLRSVFERLRSIFELRLTDFYWSTYYDTNLLYGDMLKALRRLIVAANA